jgi:hypothetical protein
MQDEDLTRGDFAKRSFSLAGPTMLAAVTLPLAPAEAFVHLNRDGQLSKLPVA